DGFVLYANPASASLQQICQAGPGQRVNEAWTSIIGDCLAGKGSRALERESQGKTFAITLTPIPCEGYVNVYASDITERIRQSRALRASQVNYRAMVDQAAVAILQASLDGTVLKVNPA